MLVAPWASGGGTSQQPIIVDVVFLNVIGQPVVNSAWIMVQRKLKELRKYYLCLVLFFCYCTIAL